MNIPRIRLRRLVASGLAIAAAASALAGEDVLECKLPAGQTLVLRSSYKFNLAPVISRHNSREYDRKPWRIRFFDADGREASVQALRDASIRFFGKEDWALQQYCAEFSGLAGGVIVGPGLLLEEGNRWRGWNDFQGRSNPLMTDRATRADIETGSLRQAGYTMIGRSRWARLGSKLVEETTLHRVNRSPSEGNPIDAVLQSTSEDDGKTWTRPAIVQAALLFEVGRTILGSCQTARPIRFNGHPIEILFPPRCGSSADAG